MNLTNYVYKLIDERNKQLAVNDSKPHGDVIANAKAEQILDNLYYLWHEAKSQVDTDTMQLIGDYFKNTYYATLFK